MSKSTIADVFGAVTDERQYQVERWGTNDEHPHDVPAWLLIMERELAEAKEAWVIKGGDREALREIVQVVAVGVACLEQHGVVSRWAE